MRMFTKLMQNNQSNRWSMHLWSGDDNWRTFPITNEINNRTIKRIEYSLLRKCCKLLQQTKK